MGGSLNFEDSLKSIEHFKSQPLWFNTIFYKKWFNKGLTHVKDLLRDDTSFLSLKDFQSNFDLRVCSLTLTVDWILCSKHETDEINGTVQRFITEFMKTKKTNQLVYKKLILNKCDCP